MKEVVIIQKIIDNEIASFDRLYSSADSNTYCQSVTLIRMSFFCVFLLIRDQPQHMFI